MKRFRWLPSRRWLVLPPILLGLCTFGYFFSRQSDLPREKIGENRLDVRVEKVSASPFQPQAIGYGTAQPSRRWTAVAEVQGRITYLHPNLDSGHLIEQGEELLRIDDVDYRLRLSQRQADFAAAMARVEELKASRAADLESLSIEETLLQVTEADVRRFESLRDNRAIAESEYERARENFLRQTQSAQMLRNALSLYASKIASAEASVALAQSRLDEAKREIDRTVIRSPLSGRLAGVSLELDQFVSAGERLFEIQDSRLLEIEAHFSLAQMDRLMKSNSNLYSQNPWDSVQYLAKLQAEIVVRSGEVSLRYRGHPVRFSEQVDAQTRTRGIVIQVENTGKIQPRPRGADESSAGSVPNDNQLPPLLPGVFCEAHLKGQAIHNVLSVPRTALEGDYVYVVTQVEGEDRLKKTRIRRVMSLGDRVAIDEGLKVGSLVAIRVPLPAIDGQLVDPIQDSQASDERPSVYGIGESMDVFDESVSGMPSRELGSQP